MYVLHFTLLFAFARLGQYEPRQFLDGRVKLPLRKFQRAIQNIEAELEEQ